MRATPGWILEQGADLGHDHYGGGVCCRPHELVVEAPSVVTLEGTGSHVLPMPEEGARLRAPTRRTHPRTPIRKPLVLEERGGSPLSSHSHARGPPPCPPEARSPRPCHSPPRRKGRGGAGRGGEERGGEGSGSGM